MRQQRRRDIREGDRVVVGVFKAVTEAHFGHHLPDTRNRAGVNLRLRLFPPSQVLDFPDLLFPATRLYEAGHR